MGKIQINFESIRKSSILISNARFKCGLLARSSLGISANTNIQRQGIFLLTENNQTSNGKWKVICPPFAKIESSIVGNE